MTSRQRVFTCPALAFATAFAACSNEDAPGPAASAGEVSSDEGINFTSTASSLGDGGLRLDLGVGGEEVSGEIEGGEDGVGCGEFTGDLEQIPPTVILMLDQSLSMDEEFGNTTRWNAMYDTLFDPQGGVVVQLDAAVRFGMVLYTADNLDSGYGQGGGSGECPLLRAVEPEFGNAAAIESVVGGQRPLGNTPTGESLEVIGPALAALDLPGPKVIVLVTDGEPDTCAVPMPDMGQAEALAAAETAFSLGVQTYIISVGDDIGQDHLQQMANVGVGEPRDSSTPAPYYQGLNPEELVEAFREVVGVVASCEFDVEGYLDVNRVCEGTVEINGEPLVCNEDWIVTSQSKLEVIGAACELIKSGEVFSIEGEWPCGVIMPIP